MFEANIVFKNRLTIPLLTEYLKTDWNILSNPAGKQDCEVIAFERLAFKLKNYFPRLKIIVIADALFANQTVLDCLHHHNSDYIISFSKKKLKEFTKLLNSKRDQTQSIPGQLYYIIVDQFI